MNASPTDPELQPVQELLKTFDLSDVATARSAFAEALDTLHELGHIPAEPPGTIVEDISTDKRDLLPVPVRLFSNSLAGPPIGVFLHLHGGGFVLGRPEQERPWIVRLAAAGLVVAAVDYRLAPEHPFPNALEDSFRVLEQLPSLVSHLVQAPQPIVVGGLSAGGNLAAALCLLARARGHNEIAMQVLNQPCLDVQLSTPSVCREENAEARKDLARMWRYYLGDHTPNELAAPLLADDLCALPPAHVVVAELDPLVDEGTAFAQRLREADVEVSLDVVPGAFHGFDLVAPGSRLARAMHTRMVEAVLARLVEDNG